MNTTWAILVSVLLLAGNAFFVAAEFALVASKRYRLEHAAAGGSRAARAALDGSRELSLMLAGAQLGITLCSGGLLALPVRAFARVVRPGLSVLNGLANLVLKVVGVHAVDQLAQAHGPQEMNILLERSEAEGSIGAEQAALLTSMLRLQEKTVGDVLIPDDQLVTVRPEHSALDIEAASLRSGRSRLAVVGPDGRVAGVVHVREAVRATTAGRSATAMELMDPPFVLTADVTVTDAVTAMRANRAQLAMVTRDGRRCGFVALEDLLEQVIGEFDDETDPVPVGRRMR
jgi:CBS domain containing-hemolysin-like protein